MARPSSRVGPTIRALLSEINDLGDLLRLLILVRVEHTSVVGEVAFDVVLKIMHA